MDASGEAETRLLEDIRSMSEYRNVSVACQWHTRGTFKDKQLALMSQGILGDPDSLTLSLIRRHSVTVCHSERGICKAICYCTDAEGSIGRKLCSWLSVLTIFRRALPISMPVQAGDDVIRSGAMFHLVTCQGSNSFQIGNSTVLLLMLAFHVKELALLLQ